MTLLRKLKAALMPQPPQAPQPQPEPKPRLVTAERPQVILFIGHFKTGSSSIQNFLASNFHALLQAGILYPSVESRGIARNMRLLLQGEDQDLKGAGLNGVEPHNALALRLRYEEDGRPVPHYYPNLPDGFQMLELLDQQIRQLQPKTVILCSEVFALLGMTPARSAVARLAHLLAGYDVTIYCHLRRVDEYLSSWHRQRLKFRTPIPRLAEDGMQRYLGTAHVEQAQMIEGWIADRFPDARLVIRNFDEVRRGGGSIHDFIAHSGADFPAGLVIPADQNPSVPSAFAEIGRRALHELEPEHARRLVRWLTRARKRIEHPKDAEVEMLGAANRALLGEAFARIAPQLDRLTGAAPFYPDLDDILRLRPVDDLEAARAALPDLRRDAEARALAAPIQDWLGQLRL